MLACHVCDRREVGDAHERVCGALDKHRPGARANGVLELVGLGGVDHAIRDAKVIEDLIKHAVRAAVHVGGDDDFVALVEQREDRSYRRHAAAKGKAGNAALEVCDEALERRARRVARPGVLPSRDGPANLHLPVRRRLVDGNVHRARGRVGGSSCMDEARREVLRATMRVRSGRGRGDCRSGSCGCIAGAVLCVLGVLGRHGSSPIRAAPAGTPMVTCANATGTDGSWAWPRACGMCCVLWIGRRAPANVLVPKSV